MGITIVKVKVKKSRDSRKSRAVEFLVDSGAVYSVVSSAALKALGCSPYRKRDFYLADGTKVSRRIGDAYFEYKGVGGPAPVIFGQKNDKNLLGATTLEALELVLDPFSRELRPCCYPHLTEICPVGAFDHSPARSAGKRLESPASPVGTIELAPFNRPYGTRFTRDRCVPSDKSLGYARMSLRDRGFGLSLPVRKMWVTARLRPMTMGLMGAVPYGRRGGQASPTT